MQAATETCSALSNRRSARSRECTQRAAGPTLQIVPAGTQLYRSGDDRRLYRVESGGLCHGIIWPDERHEVIEFAFPGEIVGLGQLDKHVTFASALVDSVVSIVPVAEFAAEVAGDDVLELRSVAAAEREFNYLRARVQQLPLRPAVARIASYLLAVVAMNDQDGSPANFIPDANSNQAIASMLQVDMGVMADGLLQLKKLGLIAPVGGGLRVLDIPGLERFADAA